MQRRTFLISTLATMTLANTPLPARAKMPKHFAKAFSTPPDEGFSRSSMRLIAGRQPDDLQGSFYMNGPAKHQRGENRQSHWFDGDGMINAFRFGSHGATHEARYVETPKFKAERDAGRFLYPSFGGEPENPLSVTQPDAMNAANISVIPVGDQLWALWEAGSATRLDPNTLDTDGFVNFGEDLSGLPFSAHPRIEDGKNIWNFGHSSFSGHLILYDLSIGGDLKRIKVHQNMPRSMVHDFMVTQNHIVIGFSPFLMTKTKGAFAERFEWIPSEAFHYLVISKNSLEIVRRYELPATFVFHHSNAGEDRDGTIHFGACAYANADTAISEGYDLMDGGMFDGSHSARYQQIALYKDGRYTVEQTGDQAEFPQSSLVDTGRPSHVIHVGSSKTNGNLYNQLTKRNAHGEIVSSWKTSQTTHLGEHLYVPKAEGAGYLIGTQFDATQGKSYVGLFAPDQLAEGPIALWEVPRTIPLSLHGCWQSAYLRGTLPQDNCI